MEEVNNHESGEVQPESVQKSPVKPIVPVEETPESPQKTPESPPAADTSFSSGLSGEPVESPVKITVEPAVEEVVAATTVPIESAPVEAKVVDKVEAESTPSAPTTTTVAAEEDSDSTIFHVRWIHRGETRMPIVTQNRNGACPMIAIVNVLLQRSQLHLTEGNEVVTGRKLMDLIGDCILSLTQRQPEDANHRADLEKNISDAIEALPKLMTGLDVNVRFNDVSAFEFTPEFLVFDLLNIPLYHGWLVDPQNKEMVKAVGNSTYNQLVERLLNQRSSDDTELVAEALQLEHFLESTASQLTYEGLCELNAHLKDGELAVLFRNNHFSTLLKQKDELFILVTDWGFLNEANVVWETLNCVDGDSHFVDSQFHNTPPKASGHVAPLPENVSPEQQIDHDLMVAMALEEEDMKKAEEADVATADLQLAMQLQKEEERRAAGEANVEGSASGATGGVERRVSGEKKKEKCQII